MIETTQRRTAADAVDLHGLTAVVTGGSSGIGLACVRRLARAGATVTVVARGDVAKQVADEVGGVAYQADLSDPDVLAGIDLTADIIVNNAGVQSVTPRARVPGRDVPGDAAADGGGTVPAYSGEPAAHV